MTSTEPSPSAESVARGTEGPHDDRELDGARLGLVSALVRGSGLVQHQLLLASTEMGLTPQQAQMLCIIDHSPRTMLQLSRLLRINKSSTTGLVDRAEHAGLLIRVQDKSDGRSWLVDLTRSGRILTKKFKRVVEDRLEGLLAPLPEQERNVLDAALSRLVIISEFPDTWPED